MRTILHGLAVSPGIALGNAWVFSAAAPTVNMQPIASEQIDQEIATFHAAQDSVECYLKNLYEHVLATQGETDAEIFASHIELLRDEDFSTEVPNLIRTKHYSATRAVKDYLTQAANAMRALDDAHLRERAAEFDDLSNNLLLSLNNLPFASLSAAPKNCIIFADDLSPTQTAQIDITNVRGFVLSCGGMTSHVAILARNIGLPAIMGVSNVLSQVQDGQKVAMDGSTGELLIDADEDDIRQFSKKEEQQAARAQEYAKLHDSPATTTDGITIKLYSNIGAPKDLHLIDENHSEGIGLFRSEFLFMEANAAPLEDTQYQAYKQVVEHLKGKPVILRLADIGGDKPLPYLSWPTEENPFLGWRGVRIYDEMRNIFDTQIRAALRAAVHGNLWIMVPMVSTVAEMRFVRDEVARQAKLLTQEGQSVSTQIKIGTMIETPAAALIAPQLACCSDFFSIGTNDLTQYTIAVDRGNTKIATLYDSLHPAVLRLMKLSADAARAANIEIGVCGEMGGQIEAIPLLVGMGFDELSISGKGIAAVKYRIRQLNAKRCRDILEKAITLDNAEQVRVLLRELQ